MAREFIRWWRRADGSPDHDGGQEPAPPSPYASIFEIPIPGDLTGEEWERRLLAYDRRGRTVADVLAIAERLAVKHSEAGRAADRRRSRQVNLDRQQAAQSASGRPVLMPLDVVDRKGPVAVTI